MSSNSPPNRNILPGIFLIQAEIILQFLFPMENFFWTGGSAPSCHSSLGLNPWTSIKNDKMDNTSKGMANSLSGK